MPTKCRFTLTRPSWGGLKSWPTFSRAGATTTPWPPLAFRLCGSTKMPALKGGYESWRNYRRRPHSDATKERRDLFDSLCSFIQTNNGWVVSVPLAKTVRFECLPNSRLPARLTELGFKVRNAGVTSRILPTHHGLVETLVY